MGDYFRLQIEKAISNFMRQGKLSTMMKEMPFLAFFN
jgi:hypothetical protein